MNLFPMSILARRAAPAPAVARTRRGAPVPTPAAAGPEDEPESPAPCGWFDSSHELKHGLVVAEVDQPDIVARVVPLSWWLEWQLRECGAQRGRDDR